ncbi:zona pellucida sperm-binding protein 1 [Gracilinanus agilis]|uniref:zona pellucida sperm-binding protein 1 n=1 Tax=Gracilinanus agilis TaxID=191870 RepID=UPI001CFC9580|nr:zona pellucida sperm-binding protein 1 [Gracilinanus agilis]
MSLQAQRWQRLAVPATSIREANRKQDKSNNSQRKGVLWAEAQIWTLLPVRFPRGRPTRIHPTGASPASRPSPAGSRVSPSPSGAERKPMGFWKGLPPRVLSPPPGRCRVAAGRIPCAEGRTAEACLEAGCCYDTSEVEVPCFYGDTATVQCSQEGLFVLVVSQNTTAERQVSLESLRLGYASGGCAPSQRTEDFVVFRFLVTQCETTIQVAHGQLVYENQLVSAIDVQSGPEGAITRDSSFLLHARCIFNASDFLPLQTEVFRLPPPAPVVQSGPLHLELRIAKDQKYSSYYDAKDFPIFKTLREPTHVEVRLLRRTDPNLVLVLHHCWATPSTNPFREPQWPLLFDGCPFAGDGYKTKLVPERNTSEPLFPTHYRRFTVATFTFVDSVSQRALSGPVYFFCSASACSPSETEMCRAVCHSGATKRRRFIDPHIGTEGAQDMVGSPGLVELGASRGQKSILTKKAPPSAEPSAPGASVFSRPDVLEPLPPEGPSWNASLKPLLWASLSLAVTTTFLVGAALFGRTPKLRKGSRGCREAQ